MALDPIARRTFAEPDRAAVQETVIAAVQANPERFLATYAAHPDSFAGRYVCADLFKETFEQYSASNEARGRYNGVVHNSAAVLSAEQFRRVLSEPAEPGRDKAVFLTGIPGAGKTSTVLADNQLPQDVKLVFEGQLSRPETSIPKIDQALKAGLTPVVVAVHANPENALRNTFRRFEELGRGAGIGVMADIQGGLPAGLEAIHREFGEKTQLVVYDFRDRLNPRALEGWKNLDVLKSEGNRDQIYERLEKLLEQERAAGRISEACYRQARGLAPGAEVGRLAQQGAVAHKADGDGRGVPEGDRQANALRPGADGQRTEHQVREDKAKADALRNLPPQEGLKAFPELAPAYALLRAAEARLERANAQEASKVADALRNELAARLERGERLPEVRRAERDTAQEHER